MGTATASAEVADINLHCTALLKEVDFNTLLGTVNVRRGVAADEEEVDLLGDMVDQPPEMCLTG